MTCYRKTAARLLGTITALTGMMVACGHDVESPKVELTRLEPSLICNAQFPEDGVLVNLVGDGFTPMPIKAVEGPAAAELPKVTLQRSVDLEGMAAGGDPIEFSGLAGKSNADHLGWASDQSMSMRFDDSNAPEPGIYAVTVTQPDEDTKDTLPLGLAVVPPPEITGIVPQSLCNGFMDQRFTVEGNYFLKIGDRVPTVEFVDSGVDPFPADTMDQCVNICPESGECPAELAEVQICKSLTVVVPANTVEPGDYRVVVHNPTQTDEQEHVCSSVQEDFIVKVIAEGPVLFYSDPPYVYNGIDTQATLFLTSIQGTPTVVLTPQGASAGDGGAGGEITLTDVSVDAQNPKRIDVTMPANLATGSYDITVRDESGCETTLTEGLVVTDQTTVTVTLVSPPFGESAVANAITITLEADAPSGSPRAFLNPATGDGEAIQLRSVTVLPDLRTLTAVVPAGTPAGSYDLVIVWPDGDVAVYEGPDTTGAYLSLALPPPVIADVAPQSIVVSDPAQTITVTGTGFAGSDITVRCQTLAGAFVDIPATASAEVCDAGFCTQTATVDAATAGPGAVCVVRVTNGDTSYGDFSAIATTNSSLNLATDTSTGLALNTARRAPVSAGLRASSAARFIYAIGGDDGSTTTPFNTVEFSAIDIYGTMNPWVIGGQPMTLARSFAGITTIGRYMYVIGGNGGAGSLASAERALILSPDEIAENLDVDLCLSGGSTACFEGAALAGDGLDPGLYSYRVAAVISPTDPVNLGGETLASDPIILRLRDFGEGESLRQVIVKVLWEAPKDALGAELSGIIAYRIYRTPADGVPGTDEVFLAEVPVGGELSFIDDGSVAPGTARPLPQGSTSSWQALPNLNAPREGVGVAAGMDPATPGAWYVYALMGHTDGTGLGSYEYLTVTQALNGRQTVGTAWTNVAAATTIPRWNLGVYRLDRTVVPVIPAGTTYVYAGPGQTATNTWDGTTEVATVEAGGALSAFATVATMPNPVSGFGHAAVGSSDVARLFVFGGTGGTPTNNIRGATTGAPLPALQNWQDEGGSDMLAPRAFMGTALQSANIFLIGGTSGTGALATTERVVW